MNQTSTLLAEEIKEDALLQLVAQSGCFAKHERVVTCWWLRGLLIMLVGEMMVRDHPSWGPPLLHLGAEFLIADWEALPEKDKGSCGNDQNCEPQMPVVDRRWWLPGLTVMRIGNLHRRHYPSSGTAILRWGADLFLAAWRARCDEEREGVEGVETARGRLFERTSGVVDAHEPLVTAATTAPVLPVAAGDLPAPGVLCPPDPARASSPLVASPKGALPGPVVTRRRAPTVIMGRLASWSARPGAPAMTRRGRRRAAWAVGGQVAAAERQRPSSAEAAEFSAECSCHLPLRCGSRTTARRHSAWRSPRASSATPLRAPLDGSRRGGTGGTRGSGGPPSPVAGHLQPTVRAACRRRVFVHGELVHCARARLCRVACMPVRGGLDLLAGRAEGIAPRVVLVQRGLLVVATLAPFGGPERSLHRDLLRPLLAGGGGIVSEQPLAVLPTKGRSAMATLAKEAVDAARVAAFECFVLEDPLHDRELLRGVDHLLDGGLDRRVRTARTGEAPRVLVTAPEVAAADGPRVPTVAAPEDLVRFAGAFIEAPFFVLTSLSPGCGNVLQNNSAGRPLRRWLDDGRETSYLNGRVAVRVGPTMAVATGRVGAAPALVPHPSGLRSGHGLHSRVESTLVVPLDPVWDHLSIHCGASHSIQGGFPQPATRWPTGRGASVGPRAYGQRPDAPGAWDKDPSCGVVGRGMRSSDPDRERWTDGGREKTTTCVT